MRKENKKTSTLVNLREFEGKVKDEFIINEFIKVKLVDDHTVVYLKEDGRDEEFIQCKYLLLNVPLDNHVVTDENNSIEDL